VVLIGAQFGDSVYRVGLDSFAVKYAITADFLANCCLALNTDSFIGFDRDGAYITIGLLSDMDFLILLKIFILPLAVGAVIAYLASPLVLMLYRRFGWLDDPIKHHHEKVVHTYAVPRGGGLVIFMALFAGVVLFLGLDKHSLGILAGALVLTLTGVVDDVRDLNPYARLVAGVVAALLVVGVGIGIAFVTNPLGEGVIFLNQPQIPVWFWGKLRTIWILADVFALIWIVWCMNMINWSKGLDGQLPGMVVVAAAVIGGVSLRYTEDLTQWSVTMLAGITAGAYFGFLPWNFFPQKMMPGYGGGSLAGYLLAVLSILSGAKLATLVLVLAVPMIDAGYVIIRRLSKGKSPVWGDRTHFHHKLLDMGWSKRKIAIFYWVISALLGLITLQLNPWQKAVTIGLITFTFGVLLLWLNYFTMSSKPSDRANG
jgi:UDP-GlcNAc:undecaprenyl-phosphate GlcNAc-1-phosphate transferase